MFFEHVDHNTGTKCMLTTSRNSTWFARLFFLGGPGRETKNIAALLVTHMAKDVGLTPVSPYPQSSSARPYPCNEGPIPETWKYKEDIKSGIGLQKMTRVEQMLISCPSDNEWL